MSKMNRQLKYISILLISYFTSYYIDFISFNQTISNFLNIIFLFGFFIFSLIRWEKSINLLIGYLLLIPEYPRSILDIVDDQLDGSITYNNLYTIDLGPIHGYLVALVLWIIAGYIRGKKISFSKDLFYVSILFLSVYVVSLSLNLTDLDLEAKNNPLYLIKPFIFMFISSSISYIKSPKEIYYLGLNISFILGMRTIFFLINDFFIFEIPKLDLGLSPYFSLGIFLFAILKKEKLSLIKWILLALSILYPSRSFILFVILLSLIFFLKEKGLKNTLRISFKALLILFPMFGAILFYLNPRLFEFFLWKIEIIQVFSGNYSVGSGMVRLLEFKNILNQNLTSIPRFIFGNGPYGTYNFDAFPLIVDGVIDSKSFSPDQLIRNKFYTTHNVISALILKTGVAGLILYSFIFLKIYSKKLSLRMILALPLFYITYSSFQGAVISGMIYNNNNRDYFNIQ